MPFLIPAFTFLAGLLASAHIGATIATADEQVAFRAAQEQRVEQRFPEQCGETIKGCEFGYVMSEQGCPIGCAPQPEGWQPPQPDQGGQIMPMPPGTGPDDQGHKDEGQGNEQCLKDSLRALNDIEKFQMKDVERQIKEIERMKVTVSPEVRQMLDQVKALVAEGKNQTDCQERWSKQNEANSFFGEIFDKINEARRAADDARCVRDNLRGFKDMERHMVGDLERRVKQIARKKVQIPQDITDTIAKMKELFAQAKQVKTCEEMQEFQQQINELQNNSQEFFMRLEFLVQAPKMIKQINRELKNMERQWNASKRRAKFSKADLADLISRGDSIIGELKGMFDEFKQVVASGDFERAQSMEENGQIAEEKMDELRQLMNTVQALANAPRHLKGLQGRANELKRTARNLERGKAGSGEDILSCLENYQPTYDALKAAVAERPVDYDEVAGAIEAAEDAIGECFDSAGELTGEKGFFEGVFGGFGGPGPGGPPATKEGPPPGFNGGPGGF